MIQGGGYTKDFKEKHCDSIKGEFKSNGVNNELKHTEGVLSMARTMIKDSASSQFFIMHKPAPHLDGEYLAFGKITEGFRYCRSNCQCPYKLPRLSNNTSCDQNN